MPAAASYTRNREVSQWTVHRCTSATLPSDHYRYWPSIDGVVEFSDVQMEAVCSNSTRFGRGVLVMVSQDRKSPRWIDSFHCDLGITQRLLQAYEPTHKMRFYRVPQTQFNSHAWEFCYINRTPPPPPTPEERMEAVGLTPPTTGTISSGWYTAPIRAGGAFVEIPHHYLEVTRDAACPIQPGDPVALDSQGRVVPVTNGQTPVGILTQMEWSNNSPELRATVRLNQASSVPDYTYSDMNSYQQAIRALERSVLDSPISTNWWSTAYTSSRNIQNREE